MTVFQVYAWGVYLPSSHAVKIAFQDFVRAKSILTRNPSSREAAKGYDAALKVYGRAERAYQKKLTRAINVSTLLVNEPSSPPANPSLSSL